MSLRLRLMCRAMRLVAKPLLARVQRPQQLRTQFNLFSRIGVRLPRGVKVEVDGALTWYRTETMRAAGIILYFHGGGFIAGSPWTHRGLAGRLARLTGLPVVLPTYRLGPEHPLPNAQQDARAVWDALVTMGHPPGSIALAGDSAGGGLALSLLAELSRDGVRPAGLVAFSPWTDLGGSGASIVENAAADPLFPAGRLPDLVGFATGGEIAPDDPRISPLFARFGPVPPVLFQYSETEILRDDTLRMAAKLRADGADVTLQGWPDAPHVWQLFDGKIPEARDALTKAASFLNALNCAPRST